MGAGITQGGSGVIAACRGAGVIPGGVAYYVVLL